MTMEVVHAQIENAVSEESAHHQAGLDYAKETALTWAAPMMEAYGLPDTPDTDIGAELYRRTTAALTDIDHDATAWLARPHPYSRGQDGGWEAAKDHQAWVRLGWVVCDDFPQPEGARGVKPSYKLRPTQTGRQLIDGWREAKGEVDSATQLEINRQTYRQWLESVRARRPIDSL